MSEAQIQRAIVAYLRHVLPGAIVTHVPNEGVRGGHAGYLDGARAKAMGQTAGFPIDCHGGAPARRRKSCTSGWRPLATGWPLPGRLMTRARP